MIFTGLSLYATEQGQITERYSQAIDQLGQQGGDQIQVRLGAIYALERIARDSSRDQSTIIEVLSAFIRTGTFRTTTRKIDNGQAVEQKSVCPAAAPTRPSADIQAALIVLGRRDATQDDRAHVNLADSCIRGAYLPYANFSEADLGDTDLANANLNNATLTNASLKAASLPGAHLLYADLTHANLANANFASTDLRGANLSNAKRNEHTVITDVQTSERTLGRWW